MQGAKENETAVSGLPYLNNLKVILLTVAVNALCVIFFYHDTEISIKGILFDSAICGLTTSLINVCIVWVFLRRLRRDGKLPAQVPQNKLVSLLPRRPIPLAMLFGLLFAVITPLVSILMIRFYQIEKFSFLPFLVWKIIYSFVLSALLLELTVLRLAQPDCAKPGDPPQCGTSVVRNPLPKLSALKSWFQTVTADFGFNMLTGFIWGSTYIVDRTVMIAPATLAGIGVSSVIMGVIVAIRMVYPVAKNVRSGCADAPRLEKRNALIALIPASPALFALAMTLPVILLAYATLFSILTLFDFQVLNFFQFFIIRALFVGLLTKGMVKLAIFRYLQPERA